VAGILLTFNMKTDNISEIKARNPIELIIGKAVALKRKSGALMGCCPFHDESNASFAVYEDTQRYYCFGCGVSGDVIDFIRATQGVGLPEALRILGGTTFDAFNVLVKPVPREKPSVTADRFRVRYEQLFAQPDAGFTGRVAELGVSPDSWKALGAVWSGKKDAWVLPFRNDSFAIVGFQFRALSGFKWTMEGSHLGLFIPRAKVQDEVYIAEGASDCAALLTLGVYAIARPAAFACHDMLEDFITRQKIKRAIIVTDFDPQWQKEKKRIASPGVESALKLRLKLSCESKIVVPPNGSKDIRADLVAGLDRKTFLAAVAAV
jgi:5S rRNA maturation endonuclease (ribonuclease M5)